MSIVDSAEDLRTLHNAGASFDKKLQAAHHLYKAILSPNEQRADDATLHYRSTKSLPDLLTSHYTSSLIEWTLQSISRLHQTHTNIDSPHDKKKKKRLNNEHQHHTSSVPIVSHHHHHHHSVWQLLLSLLQHPWIQCSPPHLPASLLQSITRAIQTKSIPLCPVAIPLLDVLRAVQYGSASFKPSLEQAVVLAHEALEQCIAAVHRYKSGEDAADIDAKIEGIRVAHAVLSFVSPMLHQHPNQKKVFDAIMPRIFLQLICTGFMAIHPNTGNTPSIKILQESMERLQQSSRALLFNVLFHSQHIASIYEASHNVITHGQDDAMHHSKKTKVGLVYTGQLFQQMNNLILGKESDDGNHSADNRAMQKTIAWQIAAHAACPWLVSSFCGALESYQKTESIQESFKSLRPSTTTSSSAPVSMKNKEKYMELADMPMESSATVGHVPKHADAVFFMAITNSILQSMVLNHDDSSTSHEKTDAALRSLANLCKILKAHRVYRPTEDGKGIMKKYLEDVIERVLSLSHLDGAGKDKNNEKMILLDGVLEVVCSVLDVEHRIIQGKLHIVWPILWTFNSSISCYESVEEPGRMHRANPMDGMISMDGMALRSLVTAYGELRQILVLLTSLIDALCDAADVAPTDNGNEQEGQREQLFRGAAGLLSSAEFSLELMKVVKNLPSGQASALIKHIAAWAVQMYKACSMSHYAACILGDISTACIACIPLDITNASATARACKELIQSLQDPLQYHLSHNAALESTEKGKGASWYAMLLMVYNMAVGLHARCCLLLPQEENLPGQEPRRINAIPTAISPSSPKPNNPERLYGYFDALCHASADDWSVDDHASRALPSWPDPGYRRLFEASISHGTSLTTSLQLLRYSMAYAAMQRLQTLYYQVMYSRSECSVDESTENLQHALNAGRTEEMKFLSHCIVTALTADFSKHPNDILGDSIMLSWSAAAKNMQQSISQLVFSASSVFPCIMEALDMAFDDAGDDGALVKFLADLVLHTSLVRNYLQCSESYTVLYRTRSMKSRMNKAVCCAIEKLLSSMHFGVGLTLTQKGKKRQKHRPGCSSSSINSNYLGKLLSYLRVESVSGIESGDDIADDIALSAKRVVDSITHSIKEFSAKKNTVISPSGKDKKEKKRTHASYYLADETTTAQKSTLSKQLTSLLSMYTAVLGDCSIDTSIITSLACISHAVSVMDTHESFKDQEMHVVLLCNALHLLASAALCASAPYCPTPPMTPSILQHNLVLSIMDMLAAIVEYVADVLITSNSSLCWDAILSSRHVSTALCRQTLQSACWAGNQPTNDADVFVAYMKNMMEKKDVSLSSCVLIESCCAACVAISKEMVQKQNLHATSTSIDDEDTYNVNDEKGREGNRDELLAQSSMGNDGDDLKPVSNFSMLDHSSTTVGGADECMMAHVAKIVQLIDINFPAIPPSPPQPPNYLAYSDSTIARKQERSIGALQKRKLIASSLAASASHILTLLCMDCQAFSEQIPCTSLSRMPCDVQIVFSYIAESISTAAQWYSSQSMQRNQPAPPHLFLLPLQQHCDYDMLCLSQCAGYLLSVCHVSSRAKPAVSIRHYTTLASMILSVLCMLPIDESSVEPQRVHTPFIALFPSAYCTLRYNSGSTTDERIAINSNVVRQAYLEALQGLIQGSTSQQAQCMLAFIERSMNICATYRINQNRHKNSMWVLMLTELCLMVVERCKGPATLRMLRQRSERLVSSLLSLILSDATHRKCTLADRSPDISGGAMLLSIFNTLQQEFATTSSTAAAPAQAPLEQHQSSITASTELNNRDGTHETTGVDMLVTATALRSIESLLARPKLFQSSSSHVTRALHALAVVWSDMLPPTAAQSTRRCTPTMANMESEKTTTMISCHAVAFVNSCHVIMAVLRHRQESLTRSMHIVVASLRSLLLAVSRLAQHTQDINNRGLCVRAITCCADALGDAFEELSHIKVASKYCPHILSEYLILVLAPPTATSKALLTNNRFSSSHSREIGGEYEDNTKTSSLESFMHTRMRHGAYALYGACDSSEIQYLFALLGGQHGSGLWRGALATLKSEHDAHFKYTGKV